MRSEIRALTGLRGIAAVWVMLGHYLGDSPANPTIMQLVSHGYIAVDMFMVLSGFVLALTYQAEFQHLSPASVARFLWYRLARIYPLYALTSILCAALAWQGFPVWGAPPVSSGLVAGNLLMVQAWVPSIVSLNATGWSISTEWAANILFPVFVVLLLRLPLRWSALVALLALGALADVAFMAGNAGEGDSALGALDWYIFPQALVRCVSEFMLGMLCWRLWRQVGWTAWLARTPVLLAILAACTALTILTMLDIVLVLLVCGLIIGVSFERSSVASVLGSPTLRWLGTISFGIYLWQLPILALRPDIAEGLTGMEVAEAADLATVLALALVFGLSDLSFRYFERPVQRWMRGIIGRRGVQRTAAAVLLGTLAMEMDARPANAGELTTPWWQERHAAKRAEAERGDIDLVLMGDSITHNYEADGPEPWHDFRPVWDRFYADRRALNLGFSGDTTASLLWRIQNGEIDGIAPSVVVILIGINDIGLGASAAETIAGIDAVVAEVRHRQPRAGIVLLGILPSACDDRTTETTRAVNAALADRYGRSAVDRVSYIDVSQAFERDGVLDASLFYDPLLTPPEPPLHPTPEGQARMAAAIESAVARRLGERVRP